MATHSSSLAWKISWKEEPGGLQSMVWLRVRHDWETSLYFSLSCIGEGNGNPLQCSCLENPREGGAWWTAVCGVAQSQTRLEQLSSSKILKLNFYGPCVLSSRVEGNYCIAMMCQALGWQLLTTNFIYFSQWLWKVLLYSFCNWKNGKSRSSIIWLKLYRQ